MESSQPQKRWVHGRSEPFVMMAWQLSLLLALRNIVAHRSTEGIHSDLHYAASTVLTKIAPVAVPIFLLLVGSAFALRWMGKRDRVVLDVLGCSLILRTIAGFIALNVLILNPLQGGSLLLRQFLYFMPSLMIGWGWIYWRLDQAARLKGKQLLLFPEDLDRGEVPREPLRAFDDYYHSAMGALHLRGQQGGAFEPAHEGPLPHQRGDDARPRGARPDPGHRTGERELTGRGATFRASTRCASGSAVGHKMRERRLTLRHRPTRTMKHLVNAHRAACFGGVGADMAMPAASRRPKRAPLLLESLAGAST